MQSSYQKLKKQHEKLKLGWTSSYTLFGIVNVLLEQEGWRTYANPTSMTNNLKKRGIYPVCRDYWSWWDTKEVIANIFRTKENIGGRVDLKSCLLELKPEEEASGEYVNLHMAMKLTGMKNQRVKTFMSKHPEACRVDKESHRRVHLPTLREWGDYRPSSYLRKKLGDEATDTLLTMRKSKYWTCFGKQIRLVYVPELAHL